VKRHTINFRRFATDAKAKLLEDHHKRRVLNCKQPWFDSTMKYPLEDDCVSQLRRAQRYTLLAQPHFEVVEPLICIRDLVGLSITAEGEKAEASLRPRLAVQELPAVTGGARDSYGDARSAELVTTSYDLTTQVPCRCQGLDVT
jgi:hypothetical protein